MAALGRSTADCQVYGMDEYDELMRLADTAGAASGAQPGPNSCEGPEIVVGSDKDEYDQVMALADAVSTAKPAAVQAGLQFNDRQETTTKPRARRHQQAAPTAPSVEKYSGLRMKHPVYSSVILRERFSSLRYLKLSEVEIVLLDLADMTQKLDWDTYRKRLQGTADEGAWATVAVLVKEPERKIAKNGTVYSRMTISDLSGAQLTLMLFREAHQDHGCMAVGSITAILNAKAQRWEGRINLSVDAPEKIIKLGTSVDLGFCKSRCQSGRLCGNPVDLGKTAYCDYHVAAEMRNMHSLRGPLLDNNLRIGMASRRTTASKGARDSKNQAPGQAVRFPAEIRLQHSAAACGSSHGAKLLSMLPPPDMDRDRARQVPRAAAAGEQSMRAQHPAAPRSALQADRDSLKKRPLGTSGMVVLLDSSLGWNSNEDAAAHARALELIRQRGGLPAPDPNNTRFVPVPARAEAARAKHGGATVQQAQDENACPMQGAAPKSQAPVGRLSTGGGGARRTGSQRPVGSGAALRSAAVDAPPPAKKPRGLQPGTGDRLLSKLGLRTGTSKAAAGPSGKEGTQRAPHVSAFAAAFGSAVATELERPGQTRYLQLVDDEEHDRLERMMASLQKKDELAQRLEAIKHLEVSAYQCHTCGTLSEKRRTECAGHQVTKVSATKRWWLCDHCNARCSTVGVRYPRRRCSKCNDPTPAFRPTSMGQAPKHLQVEESSVADKGAFKVRGVEHSFSLNA